MTAHCERCRADVDLDLALAPVPDVVLCGECQVVQDGRSEEKSSTGDASVEILELGGDGIILGVNVAF